MQKRDFKSQNSATNLESLFYRDTRRFFLSNGAVGQIFVVRYGNTIKNITAFRK